MTPERHGALLVRDVVARADDPDDPLTTIDALELVTPADVELILHPSGPAESSRVIAAGVGASPGVASGAVALDAGRALDLSDRGQPYVLVRTATGVDDEPALARAAGVLTASGGIASHAAILARGRGIPAVCGADALRISAESEKRMRLPFVGWWILSRKASMRSSKGMPRKAQTPARVAAVSVLSAS